MKSTDTADRSLAAGTPGRFGQFLLACCGADRKYLHERAERNWYYSLGFSVIVTALIAGLSAGLVIAAVSPTASTAVVVSIGVLWAVAVFGLDRLIVSRIHRHRIGAFGARLVLAAGVAVVTATGVELILFQSEIDHQVRMDNAHSQRAAIDEWQQEIADIRDRAQSTFAEQIARPGDTERMLDDAILALTTELADAHRILACETQPIDFMPNECASGTGLPGNGPLAQIETERVMQVTEQLVAARERLLAYTIVPVDVTSTFTSEEMKTCGFSPSIIALTPQESDRCGAALLVDGVVESSAPLPTVDNATDGPIRRITALSTLSAGEHGATIWILRLLLFVVVASIDLVPLTAKLFGGETGHDLRARADKITATSSGNS